VLVDAIEQELDEFGFVFVGENGEMAGQVVLGVIGCGSGFSSFGFCSG